jgi:hypothetical protein
MPKIDANKFIAYLDQKWGTRPCTMCGQISWAVNDSVFQIIEFQKGLVHGGAALPVIPVICRNCGNTVFVNAVVAGIVEGSVPEKEEEPK